MKQVLFIETYKTLEKKETKELVKVTPIENVGTSHYWSWTL